MWLVIRHFNSRISVDLTFFYYRLLNHFRLTYFKFSFNVPFLPWLYDVFGGIEGNIGLIWVNDQTHKGSRRVEYHLYCGCSLLFLAEPIDLVFVNCLAFNNISKNFLSTSILCMLCHFVTVRKIPLSIQ